MKTNILKLTFFSFLLSFCSLTYSEELLTRIGYAYDKDTNELLYTENHFEIYQGDLIQSSRVIYKDPEQNIIARKSVDFSQDWYLPEFSLKNIETGHIEEARHTGDKYKVVFSKTSKDTEKDSLLNCSGQCVSDAGFDNFVINNWEALISGQKFKKEFLIPSMMKFITFRIYENAIVEENGITYRQINIEPDSILLRAFAGTTRLYYAPDNPQLKRFDGVSNMRDLNGDNYKVVIKYQDSSSQVARRNTTSI